MRRSLLDLSGKIDTLTIELFEIIKNTGLILKTLSFLLLVLPQEILSLNMVIK